MGIKFHCPNGHKMHVKSFLAGKKGICPKCGVRIEIPLVSDADAPPASALEPDALEPENAADGPTPIEGKPSRAPAFGLDLSGFAAASSPTVQPQGVAGPSETPDAPLELEEELDLDSPDDLSVLSSEPPPGKPLLPAAKSAESWYASLANGTTVGPMSAGAVLWGLKQGQFSNDSLVWRDGWSQWQPLGSVLSQMNPPPQSVSAAALSPIKADDPLAEALGRQIPASSSMVHGRRRTQKELRTRVALILLGLVIILFALMMYVLSIKRD